jgi:hypothetical protein
MSEHTKELIRELDAIRGSAKLCPSGAQGQTIGQETWRITLSGNSLQSITDAADKLNEFEQQRDKLLAALESLLLIPADSEGVAGYHLNGAVANWDEFPEVNEAALLVTQMKGQS